MMSDSDNMSDEKKSAQVLLDKLCEENRIPRFLITAKKAPWKKLVLSMCGINQNKTPKTRGPKPREQEQIDDFLQSMMCFLDFGSIYDNLPQPTMEDAYKDYLKHQSKRFRKPFKNTKSLENTFYQRYQDFINRRKKAFEDSNLSDPD
ncbi:MAG: hypothetical protein J0L77_01970 [Alphaproteobacteria bacterium]|nr:hypothetical protein [Alphaproteobacteria bacterium]